MGGSHGTDAVETPLLVKKFCMPKPIPENVAMVSGANPPAPYPMQCRELWANVKPDALSGDTETELLSFTERPQVRKRAPLSVQAQVRVTFVNLFVAVTADLPPDICRYISIRKLGDERVTQRVKTERLELPPFALFLHPTIGVNARRSHDALEHARQSTVPACALGRERWAKFRCRIVATRQR